MVSYGKYKFETGKEPVLDRTGTGTGTLYKCESKQVYDTSYKLYHNLTDEKKKERKFKLCTLATEDDNKHLLSLMITIGKMENNWDIKYGTEFNTIKQGIINNCMLKKKNNYYDVLDIMLENLQRTFVNVDNFKIFLNDVLLKDYIKINLTHDLKSRIIERVNTVISALTIEKIQKLDSFDIFSKIIKLIVADILSIIFDVKEDFSGVTQIDTHIQTTIKQINIDAKNINDEQTLLGEWCKQSIDIYVYNYLHSFEGINIPQEIEDISFNGILEYRNNLIKNILIPIYDLNDVEKDILNNLLSNDSISISLILEQLKLKSQTGGSNIKPHTRINYINNKNMYYNL